jgi:hypothetical protein
MLHQGVWDDKRLFDRALVQRMTSYAGLPIQTRSADRPGPASGLCWWVNFDGVWPNVPRDAFAGAGAGQELLLVVPSLDLVVVRNGAWIGPTARFWRDAVDNVFDPVVEAARTKAPYPQSPVIRGVSFAPESSILRKAIESDNWPITWGDAVHRLRGWCGLRTLRGPQAQYGIRQGHGHPFGVPGDQHPLQHRRAFGRWR